MKQHRFLGWTLLIGISLAPVIAWLLFSPQNGASYGNFTHALGQITALVGMTMFALTFILSTRAQFIEDIFGGLDKVYVVHAALGASAFILLLFHPLLLVLKYVPGDLGLAAEYLWWGHWAVNFGIIALLGMVVLIAITYYMKVRYNTWKLSHKFMGLFFSIAVLHVLFARSVARDNIFDGYYIFVSVVSLLGLSGFFYSLFFKHRNREAIYKIDSVNHVKGELHDIVLAPAYKPIRYKSGQFVFLQFFSKNMEHESHPFSIASKTNDQKIRVVIKNLGDFTGKLHHLQKGDKVLVEGPYGRFNYYRNNCEQIWIAAGIGITPFIGMAEDLLKNKNTCNIDLYYSARNDPDIVAKDAFENVSRINKRFRLHPWITSKHGRLSADDVMKYSGTLKGKEILLCGPKEFKLSFTKAFMKIGVPKSKILDEEFSFR